LFPGIEYLLLLGIGLFPWFLGSWSLWCVHERLWPRIVSHGAVSFEGFSSRSHQDSVTPPGKVV
jgi:hypothetical protein